MTADQRLDQLEPLLSEAITVLDRHTVQLRQLHEGFAKNTALLVQQSDNISFLLDENVAIKDRITALEYEVREVKVRITRLEKEVVGLKKAVARLEKGQADLQKGQADLRKGQEELNRKLDLILSKLS